MRSLVELQDAFARAMTTWDDGPVAAELVGGPAPASRLAIHLRHYDASLANALCDKFPACAWLVGADAVRAAARDYAHRHPPRQPCIAEYGGDFPRFLAAGARALPYFESFGALEWAVSQASIAIDEPPLLWSDLAHLGADALVDSALALQPGLRYVRSAWRIDALMTRYLEGAALPTSTVEESPAFVEVSGARGDVRLARLDAATFAFRSALAERLSIGEAAGRALEHDAAFDAGEALRLLADAAFVVAVTTQEEQAR